MSTLWPSLNKVQSRVYVGLGCPPDKQQQCAVGLLEKCINVCLLGTSHWWGMQAVKVGDAVDILFVYVCLWLANTQK